MKKYSVVFLLIITVNLKARAQEKSSPFLDNTEFKIGYYGNIAWSNGLNLGAEYTWKEYNKVKEKKKGPKTINRQRIIHGSLGFSTNFRNQTDNGLTAFVGHVWRRTNPKRWQFNLELNPLGYYRSFLPETFEVKGGEVSKVRFPGRSYYAPSFAIGMGRVCKETRQLGWYLNFNCTFRTPYNAGTLPVFSLQYGHRFNFKNNK